MNKQFVSAVLMGLAAAEDENYTPDSERPDLLNAWVQPDILTGTLTMLLLFMFFWWGYRAAESIAVPPYQLTAPDAKNKENAKDWSAIWGAIEK